MSEVEDEYLEWYVEEKFVEALERNGWVLIKGDKIIKGFPDRVCFGPNAQTVFVEFKRTGAKPRRGEKLQEYYAIIFKKLGFEYYKVTGQQNAEKLKNRLLAKGSTT
jgi:hypothetical protein